MIVHKNFQPLFHGIWNRRRSIEGEERGRPYCKTGEVAKILGLKSSRQAARMIDRGELRGRYIDGKDGRGCRSYRVVFHSSLMRYIERSKIRTESAISWCLVKKIEALEELIKQAVASSGMLHLYPGLAQGIIAVLDVLHPDTVANFDPLCKTIIDRLSALIDLEMKLRKARLAVKAK